MSLIGTHPRPYSAARRPDSVIAVVGRVLSWPGRVLAARRELETLARMSDYELRDIGLGRHDVRDATALPLDMDPTARLAAIRAEREASGKRRLEPR